MTSPRGTPAAANAGSLSVPGSGDSPGQAFADRPLLQQIGCLLRWTIAAPRFWTEITRSIMPPYDGLTGRREPVMTWRLVDQSCPVNPVQ